MSLPFSLSSVSDPKDRFYDNCLSLSQEGLRLRYASVPKRHRDLVMWYEFQHLFHGFHAMTKQLLGLFGLEASFLEALETPQKVEVLGSSEFYSRLDCSLEQLVQFAEKLRERFILAKETQLIRHGIPERELIDIIREKGLGLPLQPKSPGFLAMEQRLPEDLDLVVYGNLVIHLLESCRLNDHCRDLFGNRFGYTLDYTIHVSVRWQLRAILKDTRKVTDLLFRLCETLKKMAARMYENELWRLQTTRHD